MDDRRALLQKLVLEGHLSVEERVTVGHVTAQEIKEIVKALVLANGSFPNRGAGAVYEGATLALTSAGVQVTWTRPYAANPWKVAESTTKAFSDLNTAVDAFIDSEWSAGMDGIRLE